MCKPDCGWFMSLIDTNAMHQTIRLLTIYRRTCMPVILFWTYSYAGQSNSGRFGQVFWV